MKNIFFALICTVIGFGATANASTLKKEIVSTSPVREATALPQVQNLYLQSKTNSLLKKERVFRFTDACGVQWDIHVFAPNGTSNWSMFIDASFFFEQGTWGNNGCYHNQP